VEHDLISVEGAEHGLADADERTIEEAMANSETFLRRHLRPES
jgi:hypothetical protein